MKSKYQINLSIWFLIWETILIVLMIYHLGSCFEGLTSYLLLFILFDLFRHFNFFRKISIEMSTFKKQKQKENVCVSMDDLHEM